MIHARSFLLVFLALTLAPPVRCGRLLEEADIDPEDYDHVIVLPDVHGDPNALFISLWIGLSKTAPRLGMNMAQFHTSFLTRLLELRSKRQSDSEFESHVIDPLSRTLLVQLGDVIDRGPDSLFCYEILSVVPKVLGWDLVPLLGNHETLAMFNPAASRKYVNPSDKGGFALREKLFAPGGDLQRLISENNFAFARLGSSALFVHGGVDLAWLDQMLDEVGNVNSLNSGFQYLLTTPLMSPVRLIDDTASVASTATTTEDDDDTAGSGTDNENGDDIMSVGSAHWGHVVNDEGSPLWTRELARGVDEADVCSTLDAVLEAFNVDLLMVGHTPQKSQRVGSRCDGRLLLVDVKMSRWMDPKRDPTDQSRTGGQPVAIVFSVLAGEVIRVDAHYSSFENPMSVMTQRIGPPNSKRESSDDDEDEDDEEDEDIHERKRARPSLSSESKPDWRDTVLQDSEGLILRTVLDDGVMWTVAVPARDTADIVQELVELVGQDDEQVLLPFVQRQEVVTPPHLAEFGRSLTLLRFESADLSSHLLSVQFPLELPQRIIAQMLVIARTLHKHGYLLGIGELDSETNTGVLEDDQVKDFFVFEETSKRVKLINFLRLSRDPLGDNEDFKVLCKHESDYIRRLGLPDKQRQSD